MTHTDDTKQATAHTPEPWRIHRLNNGWPVITSDAHDIADLRLNGNGLPHVEANARRIVAAVNACKGISTEALERGVIAELRHILGELLDAAGDLDAAIDGVTEEFDTERNRLNAACGRAQAILDGAEIGLHDLLAVKRIIGHLWGVEDVQDVRLDLDDEQAWQVLQTIEQRLDSQSGMNWDTIESIADELFGPAPETDQEEE